jgi:DMSO/TMAO reductase YedYZ molybdopterin-dependent catalytic subunit
MPTAASASGSRVSRRRVIQRGVWAAAAVAVARLPLRAFGAADEAAGDQVIPFLEPHVVPPGKAMLHWDELKDWITPLDQLYGVQHYGVTKVDGGSYRLEIGGLVDRPKTLELDEIKKLPKKEVIATLECSGNGAGKDFCGAIGNVRWGGTPLAPLLKECGIAAEAIEVAFWGADHKAEKIRDGTYEQNFARALPMADALREDLILAYEVNGQPLSAGHGFPLRLIVPGWYGITWVKWLQRIEVRDRRLMTRFMARDYVTIRGEERPDGSVAWKESSVGPMNLKSFVARVVRRKEGTITITGAAWAGLTAVKAVEVKIDEGEWKGAKIDESHSEPYTWRFWSFDWKNAAAGEHTIVSRAIDEKANVQPAADDPAIKLKKTYWEANQQWPRRVRL